MKEGEKIAVSLSFDSSDNTNIIANDGEYKKYLTIKKEMVGKYLEDILKMEKAGKKPLKERFMKKLVQLKL